MGNLATHFRNAHNGTVPPTASSVHGGPADGSKPRGVPAQDTLDEWRKNAHLNPKQPRTQEGFYRVFAAGVLQDDLPFTAGEKPGMRRILDYAECKHQLPTDTTVRNKLETVFTSMEDRLKSMLEVRSSVHPSSPLYNTN